MRWLLSLFLAAYALCAQSLDPAVIDALAERALKTWDAPGLALAIVEGDRVVYLKGHGVKELGKPETVTPDSIFQIASTTKAFTTAALAMLVDEGKLAWDDPVAKHYPGFRLHDPVANELVTVRDLVSHRTGLSRNDSLWYRTPFSREDIIRRIGFVALNKPIRAEYQYQNIMFLTAGEIAGRAAGSTWDDFIERRIFAPLGMKNSTTRWAVANTRADRAMPHRKPVEGPAASFAPINFDNVGGAGCIYSSARDLAQWLRLQLNGGVYEGKRLVSEKQLAETHTPQMVIRMEERTKRQNPETTQQSYGLGWRIEHYRGQMIIAHAGVLDGYRALVTMVPAKKVGIAVLSNLGRANVPETLTNMIVDQALGLPEKDWFTLQKSLADQTAAEDRAKEKERLAKRVPNTKPSHELTAYAGVYDEPAYGRVTVRANSPLEIEWAGFGAKLEHFHFDTFTAKAANPLEDATVQFELDAAGEVVRLRILDKVFTRVAEKK